MNLQPKYASPRINSGVVDINTMEYNVYGSALKNKCKIIFARRLGVLTIG